MAKISFAEPQPQQQESPGATDFSLDEAEFDLGGGGNAFSFENVGDSVSGTIISVKHTQQTDIATGEPAVWDNGEAKMQHVVTLATSLKDDATDDGIRTLYLKGSRKPESKSSLAAVLAAVREATGRTALRIGSTLGVQYIGLGEQKKKGFNKPKQYSAKYVPAGQ